MLVRGHVSLSCSHAPTNSRFPQKGGRQKGASLTTVQAKETPGAGAKKEIAESTAPKVDAVEVQVTLDFQKFFIQSTSGFFVTILAFFFWQNAALQAKLTA